MRPHVLILLVLLLHPVLRAAQSPDLAARSRVASQQMSAGRYDEASRIYRELLQALPDDPGLLMNLGMALAMGGHEADAVTPLARAVALKPDLFPAQLFLGTSYLALGKPQEAIPPLERVVAAQPAAADHRRALASAYAGAGRNADAVTQLRRVTELVPKDPTAWYALGHGYNAIVQEAMSSFNEGAQDRAWQQLLVADALLADGRFTDAFALYRTALGELPSMIAIHDSIARIYEQTGHADWAMKERARGVVAPSACAARKALCEFRAGRFRGALTAALASNDPEHRYWRVRAATELARAAFKQLETLPDSRERHEVRATYAMGARRYMDAVTELKAALKFAPGDPALTDDLGTAYYLAREYEQAFATLSPLLKLAPEDARLLTMAGDSLLQLQRLDEAIPLLRTAVDKSPGDAAPRLTLGRAYVQKGDFAAAIPLIEPQLQDDQDGSLHVQLARAYTGVGQRDKAQALLEKSQAIQREAQERNAGKGERAITPPE